MESDNNNLKSHQADEKTKTSRPVSFYDNYLNNTQQKSSHNGDQKQETSNCENNPSQAHLLMTTVPQNIAAQPLGGKHTPTRNSLRHSRMIVMNRNGRVPLKYLPVIIRYQKLAKSIMIMLILLGVALCLISVWLLLWSPNFRKRDSPYWSGIPVLLSGVIGCVLLCCCSKPYPGRKMGCYYYTVKFASVITSIVATLCALGVATFTATHTVALATSTCEPPNMLNTTCVCENTSNRTVTFLIEKSYHYLDFTCEEVENVIGYVMVLASVTNLVAIVFEVMYLFMQWRSRRKIVLYSKVPVIRENNNGSVR